MNLPGGEVNTKRWLAAQKLVHNVLHRCADIKIGAGSEGITRVVAGGVPTGDCNFRPNKGSYQRWDGGNSFTARGVRNEGLLDRMSSPLKGTGALAFVVRNIFVEDSPSP